ncbi:MAG: hypothetical protein COX65_02330 [Elusimicrobia bacterium CG_4_10_14_0_2_um_filter_56_8]|nr:MAG: hypothetical protein AUJ51_01715 [Elusimicrobia bacterium CG1_02_56_21]PJA16552.1 MAG: hypothetical protein COX65_02330 [Elusimicrobia bacterium CG_4_10_14_0_2_um_filter_56_8]
MMLKLGFVLAFCAVAAAGCNKPPFQTYLSFAKNGNKYDFRVSIAEDKLYISCKYNGADIDDGSGWNMAGRRLTHVAAKDLNADGYPEVYAFYDLPSSWPSIKAITCIKSACSQIGVEGAAGGPAPENYCGEDAYSIENNLIVRKYRLCNKKPTAGDGFGTIAYKLSRNSFGYILNSVDTPVPPASR